MFKEFPGVLIDTSTGKIEEEFQQYVRPEENNRLSAFCTQLTGIKQQQVDRGIVSHFFLFVVFKCILKLFFRP